MGATLLLSNLSQLKKLSLVVVAVTIVGLVAYIAYSNYIFWRVNDGIAAFKLNKNGPALQFLITPARLGNLISQRLVGCIYAQGHDGVEQDLRAAGYWFAKAGLLEFAEVPNTEVIAVADQKCNSY